jgi:hypothetical protein
MPLTQPDNIYFADNLTPMSASGISAAEASSVQAAFSNFRDEVADQLQNLPPFAAQCSRTGDGIVTGLVEGVYQTTGLAGTIDSGLNSLSPDFVLGANDALGLRNNSNRTRLVRVYASADCISANNQNLGIKLALNGSEINETECRAFTSGTNQPAKLVTSWIVSMAPASEVSIFLANHSGTQNITVQRARVVASAVV